ncbi:hypothetical protein MKW98_022228 [Papaver atlanticum]|uniref:Uncharacterized protein n=1 Tax=Papaver atlanticum TaxID=357466 RepID=A0AAD4XSB0_9MAGN|nr:hypothetical protein MKW98_022228 [Papaver atlanticum]
MGRKGKGRKSHGRLRSIKHQTITNGQPPEWVINFNNCLLEGPDLDSGRSWTIYRIPRNLVNVHKPAYIPKIISIGPFYYQEPRLQAMEEHKTRYLLRVLGYTGLQHSAVTIDNTTNNQDNKGKLELAEPSSHVQQQRRLSGKDIHLEDLVAAMKGWERKTRECYSEKFDNIESDDFVQMMVIDGCFVIELLRLFYNYYFEDDNKESVCDPIFTTRWMIRSLQRDLLMLQNQLPFFVLQELFNLTSCPGKSNMSLVDLTLKFFAPLLPRYDVDSNRDMSGDHTEYDHLLDILRTSFITEIQNKKPISRWRKPPHATPSVRFVQEKQLIHSVKELQDAGVKFLKKEQSNLLDIDYEDGKLKIPPLYIDDNTVPVLLNFVAYEQCDEEAEPYFTNHLMFFDSSVNTSLDVEILHYYGIVNHLMGSDKDVTNLINRLCREIVYDVESCHLSKQMREVNEAYKAYYATRWHKWWANLIRDYFSSPWTFLSPLAAIILLLLTSAQTFFAIYAYFKPPKT